MEKQPSKEDVKVHSKDDDKDNREKEHSKEKDEENGRKESVGAAIEENCEVRRKMKWQWTSKSMIKQISAGISTKKLRCKRKEPEHKLADDLSEYYKPV